MESHFKYPQDAIRGRRSSQFVIPQSEIANYSVIKYISHITSSLSDWRITNDYINSGGRMNDDTGSLLRRGYVKIKQNMITNMWTTPKLCITWEIKMHEDLVVFQEDTRRYFPGGGLLQFVVAGCYTILEVRESIVLGGWNPQHWKIQFWNNMIT